MAPRITLLTDFGTRDHYVAVMKGVIARICPEARVVDVSHEVTPYQIAQGAYILSQAWPWFPLNTVHVAVVDPGVGSRRRALAAASAGHYFVLPDNGLIDALGLEQPEIHVIQNESLYLHPVSRTFHGRDVFAPVAAHLARGIALGETGPRIEDWVRMPAAGQDRILHVDRFGTIITSLRAMPSELRIGDRVITSRATHYDEAPANDCFLIIGSGGYVEISVREGSAAERLGVRIGQAVSAAGR